MTPEVTWVRDPTAATWIADRLAPFGQNTITSVVPGGFEAYARLLHPVETEPRGEHPTVRWSDVARWSGMPLTATTQFYEIAVPPRPMPGPAPGAGSVPAEGSLCTDDARALIGHLGRTDPAVTCLFALWDGYGWDSPTLLTMDGGASATSALPDPIPADVRGGPRVELPARSYLLYTGGLGDALAWTDSQQHTPNLWWPQDRSWCVASEIDLAWTYVGGSRELIDSIVADTSIEALPAQPDDDFQLRTTGHIADLVDAVTEDLLTRGHSSRSTSRGEVDATLIRPGRLHSGSVTVDLSGEHGSGSGGQRLTRTDVSLLPERVRRIVAWRLCEGLPRL